MLSWKRKPYLNNFFVGLVLLFLLLMTACGSGQPLPTQSSGIQGRSTATVEGSPSPTLTSTLTPVLETSTSLTAPTVSLTISPSPTLNPSPTPEPYAGLTIDGLTSRSYGGGEVQVHETLADNSYFTRKLISYPSDGLTIYGFMDIPKRGNPPYPVIIALHGYIDPAIYDTIDYTTRYADALARAGFLVLHPNLRGYPPSDNGDNLFRVGVAVDTLNLIALVKGQGGRPGVLEAADPGKIGLWGHSMGGSISIRVMTVSPEVRAVVLYGSMSGDEQKNFERIATYFQTGTRGREELSFPAELIQRISPINYLDRVQAAVSIHHGKDDVDVPLGWSLDLCDRLKKLGKSVECFNYPGEPHTFYGEGDLLFTQRMIDFYNQWLRTP